MMQFRSKFLPSFIVTCAFLTFASTAVAQAVDKVKVRLDWTPWGLHGAMHLAQQKGWYKSAGLDVEIEDGNGSVTTIQIVGSGDQFDVGHAALGPMMIARDKGLPVKAIAVFARISDLGVLVPSDSGIKGPRDLKGKKVAYTAGSLEAPFIDAFLAAGGLKRSDVELVSVDAAAKAATYVSGRTDAVFSTIPFSKPSWRSHGRPTAFALLTTSCPCRASACLPLRASWPVSARQSQSSPASPRHPGSTSTTATRTRQ